MVKIVEIFTIFFQFIQRRNLIEVNTTFVKGLNHDLLFLIQIFSHRYLKLMSKYMFLLSLILSAVNLFVHCILQTADLTKE